MNHQDWNSVLLRYSRCSVIDNSEIIKSIISINSTIISNNTNNYDKFEIEYIENKPNLFNQIINWYKNTY